MSDISQLRELLRLEPFETCSPSFGEFLAQLRDNPQMANTVAALMIRAITGRDQVEIEKEPPERRPYLVLIELSDEENEQRKQALLRLDGLGYCEHCRTQALNYFRDFKLWSES